MVTHTIDSYWIPSKNKTKSKKQMKRICQNFNTLRATHLLKSLDNMCKYEMNPVSVVEDTERTRYTPFKFVLRWAGGGGGGINMKSIFCIKYFDVAIRDKWRCKFPSFVTSITSTLPSCILIQKSMLRRHMSAMASQVVDNLTDCSKVRVG